MQTTKRIAVVLVLLSLFGASLYFRKANLPTRDYAGPPACANNLRQIGQAIFLYCNKHHGAFPDTLGNLLSIDGVTPAIFVCPESVDTPVWSHQPTDAATRRSLGLDEALTPSSRHCSYVYVGAGLTSSSGSEFVVAFEAHANHPVSMGRDAISVLFADGHVEFVRGTIAAKIRSEFAKGNRPIVMNASRHD